MSPVVLILILFTAYTSYKGFKDLSFFHRYALKSDQVWVFKQYERVVSAGFLHADWWHYGFNMYALYAFASSFEIIVGSVNFSIIFFASLIGGNLLALFFHRHDSAYMAVGASGAVCGVIFGLIALFPDIGIRPLFIPFSFPGWIYGVIYIFYCIYGIKSLNDNVGHDAHLGGAIVGLLTTIAFYPEVIATNGIVIALMVVPAIVFLIIILKRPGWLYIQGFSFRVKNHRNVDDRYQDERYENQQKVDKILEKIHAKGIDSLTKREREILEKNT